MSAGARLITALAAAFGCLAARGAWAQTTPKCSASQFPNPIYVTGSTAYQPTAALFAAQLGNLAASQKATIIYQTGVESCDGPAAIFDGQMLTGTATVWKPGPKFATDMTSVTPSSCTLDGTHAADVGVSDIFWASCPNIAGLGQPATIADNQGPVQAVVFVVANPQNSMFTALSAAEAQLIWGCGLAGMVSSMVSSFTDNAGIQQRNSDSGTQGIVAAAINVPPTSFFGSMNAGSSDLLASFTTYVASNDPTKAIGFVGADVFDQNRTTLYQVAFQGFTQTKAYYADSNQNAKDQANVRDGHYVVWGPEHFFVKVDDKGAPTDAAAAKFLGATSGTMYQTSFDYAQLEALAGVVPQCAMRVARDADGGPVRPQIGITDPCNCFYEKVRTGTTTCTACPNGSSDCTGGMTCHHGYCE